MKCLQSKFGLELMFLCENKIHTKNQNNLSQWKLPYNFQESLFYGRKEMDFFPIFKFAINLLEVTLICRIYITYLLSVLGSEEISKI